MTSHSISLLGAICGDIIGSAYEFHTMKRTDFDLFLRYSHFTDDTVMTIAVAHWIMTGDNLSALMQTWGRRYLDSGYGGMFWNWLFMTDPQPYFSYGNGSAMRVSPVGWAYNTLDETLAAARASAEVTHNHPEGIKGAQATAAAIFLARTGHSKPEIKHYIADTFGYDLNRTCDEIRPGYCFDVTCQGSVPESIIAFLESSDYESAIRLTVSLDGDADTMGAITGAIAAAYYGEIPDHIANECLNRLPDDITRVISDFSSFINNPHPKPIIIT